MCIFFTFSPTYVTCAVGASVVVNSVAVIALLQASVVDNTIAAELKKSNDENN